MNDREQELERRIVELEAENASLTETKSLLGARTSLAWMGMASAAWRHSIGNKATTIVDLITLIRMKLETKVDQDYIRLSTSRI